MIQIFVDADGCPVVNETISAAKKFSVPVTLITDTAHIMNREGATTITVEKGSDSADFRLVNLVQRGDVVITQDYGLAALCLAKRAVVLHQDGYQYTEDNIDSMLHDISCRYPT